MKLPWTVLAVALLVQGLSLVTRPALAEDLDPKQLVGLWKGATPSPATGYDQWELCVKGTGAISGDVQSVRGGLLDVSGSYKVAGDTVEMQGDWASVRLKGAFTFSLKGSGTELQGTGTTSTPGVGGGSRPPYPASFKKVKPAC